jgi:hypothetical protein
MGTCGHALWYLREFEEAERLTQTVVAHAKQTGWPVSILHAMVNRLYSGLHGDRPEDVLGFAEEAHALGTEHDLKFWRSLTTNLMTWAHVRSREPCPEDYRAGFAEPNATGAKLGLSIRFGMLADVERTLDRKREALEAVDRALAISAENGEGEMKTWLLRLRADVLAQDDPEGAEAAYGEALRLAVEQGSPVLELLAALSLSKFLSKRGRVEEACAILSPTLDGWSSPTPHLPAIAEAKALLAALGDDTEVKTASGR